MLPDGIYENRVLRRTYRLKGDEMTGGWRKPDNETQNLYFSPSIIGTIKSRRMRWAGHLARMEKREMNAGYW
jgi:hypothetical protein